MRRDERWRENISKAKKGVPLSPERRRQVTEQLRAIALVRRGVPRSLAVRQKISRAKLGIATVTRESHGCWKGDNVGYSGIHQWLNSAFGRPVECQNSNCKGRSSTFDWALKRDVEHGRKRENYLRLCRSCHRSYDRNLSFDIAVRDLGQCVSI